MFCNYKDSIRSLNSILTLFYDLEPTKLRLTRANIVLSITLQYSSFSVCSLCFLYMFFSIHLDRHRDIYICGYIWIDIKQCLRFSFEFYTKISFISNILQTIRFLLFSIGLHHNNNCVVVVFCSFFLSKTHGITV